MIVATMSITINSISSAEIAATAVDWGLSKISRLGAPRETIPASPAGHARMLPARVQILEAVRRMI